MPCFIKHKEKSAHVSLLNRNTREWHVNKWMLYFRVGIVAGFYSCLHAFYWSIFLHEKMLLLYLKILIEFEWKQVFEFVLLIKPLSFLTLYHWLYKHSYSYRLLKFFNSFEQLNYIPLSSFTFSLTIYYPFIWTPLIKADQSPFISLLSQYSLQST